MSLQRLRRVGWRHPEWWALALSAGAWAELAAESGGRATAWGHHGFAAWSLMVVAMMIPLVVGPIRTTAARSLWCRRHRAVAMFLAGYLILWLCAGAAAFLLAGLLGASGAPPSPWLAALGFAMAAGWQLSPVKRRALNACHRTAPLAPHGARADRDCLRFGAQTGAYCLTSCWALMLACMLSAHAPAVLLGVSIVLAGERYLRWPGRRLARFGGSTYSLAAWVARKRWPAAATSQL